MILFIVIKEETKTDYEENKIQKISCSKALHNILYSKNKIPSYRIHYWRWVYLVYLP
ncbi:hypothetical protein SAMN05421544_10872 [Riemerella columbipharyngis]|uniref:Uncharacterized protein n=1 Tax=Riemerella columbipharyngis TaxID=1071918 RepID=A0A1G7CLB4_9FLAO|nr:hypothetical protein SAMN05421544_10872 [Riemerella columbipharyngis]